MTNKEAARQLLAAFPLESDLIALINDQRQAILADAEEVKYNPLQDFRMPVEDFETFCLYLTDGGGVTDDMSLSGGAKSLTSTLWQAIFDRDQKKFWKKLPHLVKSWVNQRGLIGTVPGVAGATVVSGVEYQPPADGTGAIGPPPPLL